MSETTPICAECGDAARKSLAQEIREGLRVRGLWAPDRASDLISAVFTALAAQPTVPGTRDDEIRGYQEALASFPCDYADECPPDHPTHGRCIPCKCRAVVGDFRKPSPPTPNREAADDWGPARRLFNAMKTLGRVDSEGERGKWKLATVGSFARAEADAFAGAQAVAAMRGPTPSPDVEGLVGALERITMPEPGFKPIWCADCGHDPCIAGRALASWRTSKPGAGSALPPGVEEVEPGVYVMRSIKSAFLARLDRTHSDGGGK